VSQPADVTRFRWFVLTVFVLSTAINYLDRQTLTTLAPLLRTELRLSNIDYGWILAAFSITYAASAPFAGMLIDRVGLNLGASVAVGLWSCAGIATGATRGIGGLVGCRAALGMAEAAGIPSAAKAIHQCLKPSERALGNALNQMAVSLGMMIAPPVATFMALAAGWRSAFVVTGLLGLGWIPLWNRVCRRVPTASSPPPGAGTGLTLIRDGRLWAFVAANGLGMVAYSLWTNWTTLYFVDVYHLSLADSASYAWIPPVFAAVGGLAGGWLSLRLVNRGVSPVTARFRVCLLASVVALATALVPLAPSPGWASGGISLSIFAVSAFSVNMYSLPLDTFGGARAASAVSALVASYGAIQAVISPAFGKVIDLYGYTPVAVGASLTPLAASYVLWQTRAAR
jgi:ACS family hexuronate transporter-like MFS transporter